MANHQRQTRKQRANSLPTRNSKGSFDLTTPQSTVPQPPPPPRPIQTSSLLSLPIELRQQIYAFALGHPISPYRRLVLDGGRSRIRIIWPSSSHHHSTQSQTPNLSHQTLSSLLLLSHQTRNDLLPSFLHTKILKFPAWNADFKARCLSWIEGSSETFVRGLSWLWLEGVYWRMSVRLGDEVCGGEDERATREDCHQYGESEWLTGMSGNFVVRVDFVKQMRRQARVAAGELIDLLDEIVGEEGRLGRGEMARVLKESRLTVEEQLKGMHSRNYGIRTVYPPR